MRRARSLLRRGCFQHIICFPLLLCLACPSQLSVYETLSLELQGLPYLCPFILSISLSSAHEVGRGAGVRHLHHRRHSLLNLSLNWLK